MNGGSISVVVPALNEAESLPALHERLIAVLAPLGDFEIVIVDDGSRDDTLQVLRGLAACDSRVRYLSLSRNFGHQHALKAGLDAATGDCVITLDADLQQPPELIPEMVERWRAGFEVVNMVRRDVETRRFKRITSALFYRFINAVSDFEIRAGAADFRLLDRQVVDVLSRMDEKTIFLRGTVVWLGFRQCEIEYTPDRRAHGEAKYDLRRMAALALDGVVSSTTRPLRLATLMGAVMSTLAMVYAAYALAVKIVVGTAISGWASLLISMLLLGGVQLLMLGIIGEYLGKVLLEVKGRPPYVIREQSEPQDRPAIADLGDRRRDSRALP